MKENIKPTLDKLVSTLEELEQRLARLEVQQKKAYQGQQYIIQTLQSLHTLLTTLPQTQHLPIVKENPTTTPPPNNTHTPSQHIQPTTLSRATNRIPQ